MSEVARRYLWEVFDACPKHVRDHLNEVGGYLPTDEAMLDEWLAAAAEISRGRYRPKRKRKGEPMECLGLTRRI